MVDAHYRQQFQRLGMQRKVQERVRELEHELQNTDDLTLCEWNHFTTDFLALVGAWRGIATGKAGGPDEIPPSALKEIPYEVFIRTHALFEKRLWGRDGGDVVDPWNKTNMCLLPKKKRGLVELVEM